MVAKKNDAVWTEGGESADESAIIAVGAVSAEFDDVGRGEAEVVEEVGALGVANDLDTLPGGEVAVDLAASSGKFLGQSGDFRFHADFLFPRNFAQFFQPTFQIGEGLFEFEGSDGSGFGHRSKIIF